MQVSPEEANVIIAALQEGAMNHSQIATQLRAELKIPDAINHEQFARACHEIQNKWAAQLQKRPLIITPGVH
jgi:hypothetical protein